MGMLTIHLTPIISLQEGSLVWGVEDFLWKVTMIP